jgi:hypothetical protein
MSKLGDLIASIDDWNAKTPSQLHSELTAESIPYRDRTLWTWAGIASVAGNAGAEGLRIALEANNMGWAVHQLGGIGMDLSLDEIQQTLYLLDASGVPGMEEVALAVKRNISKLQQAGITATLSQVELEQSKRIKILAAAQRYNIYLAAINLWDGGAQTEPTL